MLSRAQELAKRRQLARFFYPAHYSMLVSGFSKLLSAVEPIYVVLP